MSIIDGLELDRLSQQKTVNISSKLNFFISKIKKGKKEKTNSLSKKIIYILDDSITNLNLTKTYLREILNFENVETFLLPDILFKRIIERKPDLIICDIEMGRYQVDGFFVKKIVEEKYKIPVLLFTAHSPYKIHDFYSHLNLKEFDIYYKPIKEDIYTKISLLLEKI